MIRIYVYDVYRMIPDLHGYHAKSQSYYAKELTVQIFIVKGIKNVGYYQ